MKKVLCAVLLGVVLGFVAAVARSAPATAAGGAPCGPKICAPGLECCVSPGPRTYTCVQPNHCRWL